MTFSFMSSIFNDLILLFQLLLPLSSLLLYIKIEFSIQYILRFQYLILFNNFPPSSNEHFSLVFFFLFSFLFRGNLKLEGRRDSGLLFHGLTSSDRGCLQAHADLVSFYQVLSIASDFHWCVISEFTMCMIS